jgi:hypothetical protein
VTNAEEAPTPLKVIDEEGCIESDGVERIAPPLEADVATTRQCEEDEDRWAIA